MRRTKNGYRPSPLSEGSIVFLILFIFLVFGTSVIGRLVLERSDFSAAVISGALVDLANSYRTSQAVSVLAANPDLERAAQLKAEDMAAKGYFAHKSPDGRTPWYWFEQAGYDFKFAGENLAVNFNDSIDVNQAWINSPTHRENLVDTRFTEIGIGTAHGVYQGRETTFVVQLFGTPALRQKSILAPAVAQGVAEEAGGQPVVAEDAKVLVPIASTSVLGENRSNEMFVAVEQKIAGQRQTAGAESAMFFVSVVKKALTSPGTTLRTVYSWLAFLITIALIFTIFAEMRREHFFHVFLGVFLLVLMGALLYLYQSFILAPLLIV